MLSQGNVREPQENTHMIQSDATQSRVFITLLSYNSGPLPQCITIVHVGFDDGGVPNVYRGKALC